MEPSGRQRYLKPAFWIMILKGLVLYTLIPGLLLWFLAPQIAGAARSSAPAAFLMLLAVLAAVVLNWGVYRLVRQRRPSLLVFSQGIACVLTAAIIEYEALPAYERLASTLAVILGCLSLTFLYTLGFWFASRRSRPAHVIAVGLWIAIGVVGVFMLYQVIRDFESRIVSTDTWITVAVLAGVIVSAFGPRILDSARRARMRRRATGLAKGRIVQLVGETRLDRYDDQVTDYRARVQYTVDGADYETRAKISVFAMRWFGRKAFIGQELPVHYDPADPARAFTDRIDRHFFDDRIPNTGETDEGTETEYV